MVDIGAEPPRSRLSPRRHRTSSLHGQQDGRGDAMHLRDLPVSRWRAHGGIIKQKLPILPFEDGREKDTITLPDQ
ncbi:MAG: hypothetical protein ACLT98_15815 [Eggerthellaceae bacterium]